ncbi:hypothetical protein D3C72_2229060 [compost metagenome]
MTNLHIAAPDDIGSRKFQIKHVAFNRSRDQLWSKLRDKSGSELVPDTSVYLADHQALNADFTRLGLTLQPEIYMSCTEQAAYRKDAFPG